MLDSVYVLDANIFIEGKKRYYAFDLVPRFWEVLKRFASDGRIVSIDRIRDWELLRKKPKDDNGERKEDELSEWVRREFWDGFMSTDDDDVIRAHGQIIGWAQAQSQFRDSAKAEFANEPDAWLIAYAKAKGHSVVTHEVLAPEAKKRVPIPNVCKESDIPWINTFDMLRALGVRLS